ncbi:hypothetical protein BGZ94_009159 [Podila epigama]|nr:hypothetical protein BGZ94_009159 [Podila epigama]
MSNFRLKVSVGPSANPKSLTPIAPNDDAHPVLIESDEFIGQVVVRIKGLDKSYGYLEGTKQDNTVAMPDSPWFQMPGGDNNLCSIQIHGRFKRSWPCDQVVFGNQFEQPLRLPPFSSVALKFVQLIDPGLEADIYGSQPWAFSPLIATMNTVNISTSYVSAATGVHSDGIETHPEKHELPPWPSSNGEHIPEDTTLLFDTITDPTLSPPAKNGDDKSKDNGKETLDLAPKKTKAMNTTERRAYFSKSSNLAKHSYRPEHVYGFDFFNPYLNFANFTLKIPGFSVDITRYWDGQPLTYVMKLKDTSVEFLAIQFELVPVQEHPIQ